jgi:glutathione S-transferase
MSDDSAQTVSETPFLVYGTTASYYTGKVEAYLRAKGIPYLLEPFSESNMRRCVSHTGLLQIPQVECPDGSWLIDSTLIIEYFERVRPEPMVSPHEPAVAFASRLIEDYADEWLWRPAMHYRWSFPDTARLMSAWLSEHMAERRLPQWMKRRWWRRRQFRTFVAGDGVTSDTRAAVEASYLESLAALESILASRPFVLGLRPTEADFGFFGPLFRHFSCDPAPARIMRERAPGVLEWVARMWNLRPGRLASHPLPHRLPEDLGVIFEAITRVYLPYLEANAMAYASDEKHVTYQVHGVSFTEPVKPYRVWCRDRLQRELCELDAPARAEVERALGSSEPADHLAVPSPRPARDLIGVLPITRRPQSKGIDSWWRV